MSISTLAVNVRINENSAKYWMQLAACKGKTDLFFPPFSERPEARVRREAKALLLCRICPVASDCKQYARDNHEYGVWGGETELQRHEAGYHLPAVIGTRHSRVAVSA